MNERREAVTDPLSDLQVRLAADTIRQSLGVSQGSAVATWGVVLGSGLGHVGDDLLRDGGCSLPYEEIPGFPVSTVPGHAGRLVLGRHGGRNVLVLQGRAHFYEGHDVDCITRPVRTLLELGVNRLLLTNAAGGINATFRVGQLMLIADHISCLPTRLLGPRVRRVWDEGLRQQAREAAARQRIELCEGVYASMPGPTYETSAEVRMVHTLGADAVGMSTVPEAVAAASRARVLGISCITNAAAGLHEGPITHDEVAEVGRRVSTTFSRLLMAILEADAG